LTSFGALLWLTATALAVANEPTLTGCGVTMDFAGDGSLGVCKFAIDFAICEWAIDFIRGATSRICASFGRGTLAAGVSKVRLMDSTLGGFTSG
jgi:hypothetical protein